MPRQKRKLPAENDSLLRGSKECRKPDFLRKIDDSIVSREGFVTKDDSSKQKNEQVKTTNDDVSITEISGVKLTFNFYNKNCVSLAKALLGAVLCRRLASGEIISGKIVETEAYLGLEDKAAHSYKGKKTPKNAAMFSPPGTAYVYNIYGMYCCMNISSQGDGAAVLLRALEPVQGQTQMQVVRSANSKAESKILKDKDLCNGPSKLCQSLQITKDTMNHLDLTSSDTLWLEQGSEVKPSDVVISKRININYAEDWKDKPLRFYVRGNICVSVRDKEAERQSGNT